MNRVEYWGAQLLKAVENNIQIPTMSLEGDLLSEDEAYEIQRRMVDGISRRMAKDPIGYKIGGCGYNGKRGKFGLHYGILTAQNMYRNSDELHVKHFHRVTFEVELALQFSDMIREAETEEEVIHAMDTIAPVLELADTRLEGSREFTDTIADNAAHAGIVLGTFVPVLKDSNLQLGYELRINGKTPEYTPNSASLHQMAEYILWLKKKLFERGRCLTQKDIFLSGTLSRPSMVLEADQTIDVMFDGIGKVCVNVVE